MFEVTCRCGQSKMSFKKELKFFIGECCEKAGYDCKGEKAEEKVVIPNEEVQKNVEKSPEEPKKENKEVVQVKPKHAGGRPKKKQEEPQK